MRAGVPYKIIGGLRFYERKEIKDMLAYMSVISNPADNLRLERIINEPKRGIGATTIASAQHISDVTGMSLFEVFEHSDEYADLYKRSAVLKGFTDTMKELAEIAEDFDAELLHLSRCSGRKGLYTRQQVVNFLNHYYFVFILFFDNFALLYYI